MTKLAPTAAEPQERGRISKDDVDFIKSMVFQGPDMTDRQERRVKRIIDEMRLLCVPPAAPTAAGSEEQDDELYHCSFTASGEHVAAAIGTCCIFCANKGRNHKLRPLKPLAEAAPTAAGSEEPKLQSIVDVKSFNVAAPVASQAPALTTIEEMLNQKMIEYDALFKEAVEWRDKAHAAVKLLDDAREYVPYEIWQVRYRQWKGQP
jgi:hypothetical protein